MTLACGKEDSLSKVDEPAKCEYTAELVTPAACSEDSLTQLRARIAEIEGAHDEL